jgi:hypothetical protein
MVRQSHTWQLAKSRGKHALNKLARLITSAFGSGFCGLWAQQGVLGVSMIGRPRKQYAS